MVWYKFWQKKEESKPQKILRPEDDPSLPTFTIKALGNDYYWTKISWTKPTNDNEKIALIKNVSSMIVQLQTGQLCDPINSMVVSYDHEIGGYITQVVNSNLVEFYEMFKKGVLDNLQKQINEQEKVIMMPWNTFNRPNGEESDD